MIDVYAWPPVSIRGSEWTEVAPVQRSRSLINGADYISAAQRKRRFASLDAKGVGRHRMGAGYMEVLKRRLAGVHAVRLYSQPINFRPIHSASAHGRQSVPVYWTEPPTDVEWTDGGTDLRWYSGTILTGTTGTDSAGFPRILVSGLRPNVIVARPGEFLTAFADENDAVGTTVQILAPARSNASGVASIRLFEALPAGSGVRVNIGTRDTAVFRPVNYPRSMQPVNGDWSYDWEFREVFADEVGGFNEITDWWRET